MKVTIVGYLGHDISIRYTASQKPVGNFNVAETVGWGENKRTQWLKCNLWGDRAEKLSPYLLKGTQVVVFGDGEFRQWKDKEGKDRETLEVNVSDLKLVGGKKGESSDGSKAPKASTSASTEKQSSLDLSDEISFDADDIPF
jgi:single-strand DNA-binding protein